MRHVTNRTWMPDDERRLKEMCKAGVSAMRAAVALRRSITSIKSRARELGSPYLNERTLKRERRALDISPIVE